MRIQTKTALWFTMLAGGIILVLNIIIYYVAGRYTDNDFRKRLELRAVVASKIHFEKNSIASNTYEELRQQYLEALPNEREYMVRVDRNTDSLDIPAGLHLPGHFYNDIRKLNRTIYHEEKGHLYAGIHYYHNDEEYLIVTSAENQQGKDTLGILQKILLIALAIKVILVFTMSFYFSKKAFQPFREMISRVKSIGVENLSLRLREKKGKDEIAELAKTFNGMLDRLQTAFDIQNNFVSNASHEFRTPLTSIIGEAELTLQKPRSADEYKAAISTILIQAEKLEALTSGLLSLAQSGFRENKENLVEIRMDELILEIRETVLHIHNESSIWIDMDQKCGDDGALIIRGNPQLLKLALSNIILNACKYSNNQQVKILVTCPDNQIRIDILDQGIGIPKEDIKHVFVPFFRASNTASYKGYGVGLPLAQNIIRQHNGTIEVFSREQKGTTVTVTLNK